MQNSLGSWNGNTKSDTLTLGVTTFMSWAIMAAGLLFAIMFAQDPAIPTQRVILNLVVAALGLVTLTLSRLGREHLAAQMIVWLMFVIISISVWHNGGLHAPNVLNYVVLIVVSGWLLGERLTQLLLALIAGALLYIYFADLRHDLPTAGEPSQLSNLIYILFILSLTTTLTLLSRRSYIQRMEEVKAGASKLAAQDRELQKLSRAVEQSPDSIIITDRQGRIEYVNEAFMRHTGYTRAEIYGQSPNILQSGKTPSERYNSLWHTLSEGTPWQGEFVNLRKDGSEIIESASISPIRQSDGAITHYVAIEHDITQARQAEAKIHQLTNFDFLTGLPNRTQLIERLEKMLVMTTHHASHGALILFNIDRFKNINDASGSLTGDAVIVAAGKRIRALLHDSDVLARISSDEFAILPHECANRPEQASMQAVSLVKAIQNDLRTPIHIANHHDLLITASLGVTLYPESTSDTAQDVLRRTDIALHRAKSAGGAQASYFEATMTESAERRFRIENELRSAIPNGELRLFLQPQFDNGSHRISAEVLVRWQHPVRGLQSPAEFITVAEESDLIIDLGIWVMTEACRLLAHEAENGLPLELSVNVSPRHFRQPEFVPWLMQLLADSRARPDRLTLEITEGIVISDFHDVVAKMQALTAHGIHFSLDDFGTGYSSLAYLKRLPIQELKIDQTFVHDVPHDVDDVVLVRTIFSVAKHMKLKVIAEGVETEEQAAFLNSCGPVVHQGYLYGKPEEASFWLAHWHAQIQPATLK